MRKQVVDALEHRASDRVPIDFGGTNCSGIHASCVEQLRAYYGLEKRPVKIYEPFQMLGLLEEDGLQHDYLSGGHHECGSGVE